MAATLEDIAVRLNLSTSTVSRSLRQDRIIHPQTRAEVLKVAQEMGYQGRTRRKPNKSERRRTIGVLLAAESLAQVYTNALISHYLEGMTAEADAHEVVLNLDTIQAFKRGTLATPSAMPTMLRDRACDVVIMQGHHHPADAAAVAAEVSLVSLNWSYAGVNHDLAGTDDVTGVRQLVDRLAALGHRRLAWVNDPIPTRFYSMRKAGFLLGCDENGLALDEQRVLPPDSYNGHAFRAGLVTTLVEGGTTGVLCPNESIATAVVIAAMAEGVRVPEDLSVTGFDALKHMTPDGKLITSVDSRIVEVGRAGVRLALQRLAQPAAASMLIFPAAKVVDGETHGPPCGA